MLTLKAYAKINLTLDILGRRSDGFHEVSMVMQTIGLCDVVEMEPLSEGIMLSVRGADLPGDEENLAYKAAKLMKEEYKLSAGVKINLNKTIPLAAGLAGGSSDAAAVIRGMNELFALNKSPQELAKLGAEIGSDVPFCILGGTRLATGRGEILTPLPPLASLPLVLAKPPLAVSTPWAYKMYDAKDPASIVHPDNEAMRRALKSGSPKEILSSLGNVLESVVAKAHPIIAEYRETMLRQGALAARMSGSGPTVFAVTADYRQAEEIAAYMKEHTAAAVFVTETKVGED